MVALPTKKPDEILTRVRVPGAASFFSLPESTFSADSLAVSVQPPFAITCNHLPSVHALKITMAATQLFGHMKMLHTLMGMGSAALAATAPYTGKAIQISCMGQFLFLFFIFFKASLNSFSISPNKLTKCWFTQMYTLFITTIIHPSDATQLQTSLVLSAVSWRRKNQQD